MILCDVLFHLTTPLVVDDAIHLDALLMAVHPQAVQTPEVLRRLRDGDLPDLPLPISRAAVGESWVYAASTIDLSPDARPFSGMYTKRTTVEDAKNLQKNIMVIGGVFKDKLAKANGYICPTVSFVVETPDVAALRELCARVQNIGRLRGQGYGQVFSFDIQPRQSHWHETLCRDGMAVRNLPACFFHEDASSQINARPPYWGMSRRELGAAPGDAVTLRDEVTLC